MISRRTNSDYLEFPVRQIITPARPTLAHYSNGAIIPVELWAIVDPFHTGLGGDVRPMGIIEGEMTDLSLQPGYLGVDDSATADLATRERSHASCLCHSEPTS